MVSTTNPNASGCFRHDSVIHQLAAGQQETRHANKGQAMRLALIGGCLFTVLSSKPNQR